MQPNRSSDFLLWTAAKRGHAQKRPIFARKLSSNEVSVTRMRGTLHGANASMVAAAECELYTRHYIVTAEVY